MTETKACISNWISELSHAHPEWEHKQVIAVAYKKCNATKGDFKGSEFCPYKVLAQIEFQDAFIDGLLSEDFTEKLLSVRIAELVEDLLPKLATAYHELSKADLLKIAYKLAKDTLAVSDFEEQEPIYFAISIPNEELAEFEANFLYGLSLLDDLTDDNLVKIQTFNTADVYPSADINIDAEKVQFFRNVVLDDPKNLVPIFIDEENQIWDGHHRYFAMNELGMPTIQVIQLPTEVLKKLPNFNLLDAWDYLQDANYNITHFETVLNTQLNLLFDDFTDDKSNFFAPDTAVSSTNVAEVGYDRNRLRIFFQNGWGYEYDVPETFYNQMMAAPSKGKFVWNFLRGRTPGRVIDNPNKITPGGVGGSIVPYFKIKGAQMSQKNMAASIRSLLKAAKKGKAEVGGVPLQQIDKPTFKQFNKFAKQYQGSWLNRILDKLRAAKQTQQPTIAVANVKTKKSSSKKRAITVTNPVSNLNKQVKNQEETDKEIQITKTEQRNEIREKIKKLKRQLAQTTIETTKKSLRYQIKRLLKELDSISDFKYSDDFMQDMTYFNGPITRAGEFEYGAEIKNKIYDNLIEVAKRTNHIPVFGATSNAHGESLETIIGFAYNLTEDPDLYMKNSPKYDKVKGKPYIYAEGYLYEDIENQSDIPITNDTELPVSIRFYDENEGTGKSDQVISDIVHLAVSINASEQDRCSSNNGDPCFISFHDDFFEPTTEDDLTMGKKKNDPDQTGSPPSDDMDEEDKESTDDEEASSKKKDEKEDEKKDDMVTLPKSELQNLVTQIGKLQNDFQLTKKAMEEDFEKRYVKMRQELKERDDMVKKFSENSLFTIKSDMLKKANTEQLKMLNDMLEIHEETVDGHGQLFAGKSADDMLNDFGNALEESKKRLAEKWL